ncbi:hypothetical protein EDD11_008509 [Mortierella claussenii]|nr:hypothetical protein EDD11_008509 [Mortierella claussenii]
MATTTATAATMSSDSSTKSSSLSASSSRSTTTSTSVPVLIAGGGPVGLFEAYLLAKLGIPVRVIEREMSVSPLSKALGIQPRLLEIFNLTGVIDQFLSRGQALKEFDLYYGCNYVGSTLSMGGADSHYSYSLFLEQAKTSEILIEELNKLGVKVDYGWELLDTKVVEPEEKGAEAYVETTIRRALSGDNTTADEQKLLGDVNPLSEQTDKEYEFQVVRSKYLIAADGGRSTVRHKLNIGFPGRTLPFKTLMWDGAYESEINFKGVTFVQGVNRKSIVAFPLTNGHVRVAVEAGEMEPGEDFAETLKDLTTEKFEELVSACIAPGKFKIKETSWLTMFKVNERRAEHFIYKNRVFLAGDAAHVHSPAGGQGMNTGLQDAHNLAWKLAFVMNKVAPPSLLDTYVEREPMADRAIALSSKLLTRNRNLGFMASLIKRIFFALAPMISRVLRSVSYAPDIAMLNIKYMDNAINQPHARQPAPAAEHQVGVRAKDGPLRPLPFQSASMDRQSTTAEQLRVHQLMISIGRFHILVFTSDMLFSKNSSVIQEIHTTNAKELDQNIDSFVSQWRTKWSYNSKLQDGYEDKDLFKVHTICGGSLPATLDQSLEALTQKKVGDGAVFWDETKVVHQKYGFAWNRGAGGIVVVRPDSHIGYRVNGAGEQAWKDVEDYFTSILAV